MNIGAFGENFPYTNFHELNMDWIIQIVKDFMTKYPDVINELNTKLNKPVFNPDGTLNDILISNGDGTTRWGNIADVAETEIYQAVFEWLDEHPEATTTVQDNSLEMRKFTDFVKYMIKRNESGSITPVYIGDYLIDYNYLPSAIVRRLDDFVVINAPTRDYATSQSSGNGYFQTYSLTDNEKKSEVNRLVGHGNSLAFDGTNYYVVPIWEYADNEETRNSKVYIYDTSFILISTLEAPIQGHAVSYDPITNKLYYFGSDSLYVIEDNQFQLYTTISNYSSFVENIVYDRTFDQDLAVYNNNFYISSPSGVILHGYIEETTSTITDAFYVNNFDSTGRFILGELEGMEFNTNGHLYAVMYSNLILNVMRNAFVVELPVNMINATSPVISGIYTAGDPTVTLSNYTQNAFYLKSYEIRSINQIFVRLNRNTNQITIPASSDIVENYLIRINCPITLNLEGNYTCLRFEVQTPGFTILTNNDTHLLTITQTGTGAIYLQRTSTLTITGQYKLNVSTPNLTSDATNNFINFSYARPLVIIRLGVNSTELKILKCGSRRLYDNAVFTGGTDIYHVPSIYSIRSQYGYISEGNKKIRLFITVPRIITEIPTISGSTTLRGSMGYVDGANTPISMTDTTNYTFEVQRYGDYEIIIVITKTSGDEFTNIANNTPIVGDGIISLTFP